MMSKSCCRAVHWRRQDIRCQSQVVEPNEGEVGLYDGEVEAYNVEVGSYTTQLVPSNLGKHNSWPSQYRVSPRTITLSIASRLLIQLSISNACRLKQLLQSRHECFHSIITVPFYYHCVWYWPDHGWIICFVPYCVWCQSSGQILHNIPTNAIAPVVSIMCVNNLVYENIEETYCYQK